MSEALIIIDIQNDYFPGGNMEVVNSESAAFNASLLLDAYRKNNLPIIHVQHISTRRGATFFLPKTEGVKLHESVLPITGEKIITKNYPNSFRGTELEKYLLSEEVKQITFCGMMSHMCIDATVRAAFDKGFICTVAHDACATRDLSFNGVTVPSSNVHASYMGALASVYADVVSSGEIVEKMRA